MNLVGTAGLICATIGGVLLATQIPSDAVMYRDRETGDMTLDSSPEAMARYEKKVLLYRLGLGLLVVGAGAQGYAS